MVKAVVIPVEGEIVVARMKGLEDLQKAVGGYIQGINFGDDAFAYLNEEGKLLGLPLNERATKMARDRKIGLMAGDFVVGPLVIVGPADDDGYDTDAPEWALALLRKE